MATTPLDQQLINLNNEIIAIATSINAKEAKMETLYEVKKEDRDTARIDDLKESIDRLSTKEASLMAERKELRHDIATQPNQGKFTYCQHAVMPLCRMSLRQLIVVSLSKCVLSVELALFEGLGEGSESLLVITPFPPFFAVRPPSLGLFSEKVVLRKLSFWDWLFFFATTTPPWITVIANLGCPYLAYVP